MAKSKAWWESQKIMVGLIAGGAILASLTVLVAMGRIAIEGTLHPDAIVDAIVWLAGLLIGGRALEGAAAGLRRGE